MHKKLSKTYGACAGRSNKFGDSGADPVRVAAFVVDPSCATKSAGRPRPGLYRVATGPRDRRLAFLECKRLEGG